MADSDRVGWGIVGCGRMAERRIGPVFGRSDRAKLIAFQSRDAAKAEAYREKFGGVASYGDLEEFLSDDRIETVYIGTPNAIHAEQAIRCLRSGKHVLVDKPMALRSTDARAMIDESHRAGRTLGVLHQQRFHPANRAMIQAVHSGELGKPLAIRMQIAMWYPTAGLWRGDRSISGGGAAMDLGPHAIDLLLEIAGTPERITATTHRLHFNLEIEDYCLARLEFADGLIAQLEFSYCAHHYGGRVEVYGEAGTLLIDGSLQQAKAYTTTRRMGDRPDETLCQVADHDCFLDAIEDFSRAVRSGVEPTVTGLAGWNSLRLVERIYESARANRTIGMSGVGCEP